MKNALLFIIIMLFAFNVCSAQNEKTVKKVDTVSFVVKGNCDQCKNRIENAADIKGVKLANWDEKTQVIKITYRADKTSVDKIKQAILKSGHDVENEKAPNEFYESLPNCCKFRDQKCDK